ncbi:S-layer family protein [Lusitaniella coriacea LEGE 07157]|uniref:S-layer family protein n=2 Tax=Lusitaniella TaxID=1983104 RepID=A0A8J7B6V3_9CYAN|nr:S-layer family protein [Lusitaniella coriacea LEGE 07157]
MSQKSLLSSILLALGLLSTSAQAQVTPDGTVGTVVTPAGTTFTITGGTTAGTNLFHSFSDFSVPTGGAAIFNNNTNIANIFSRVTGGSISNIDGAIQAAGTANLFLLNPNGILFGSNASLQIGGSFLATTADSMVFADSLFSATQPNATTLLSINVPIGLQMGANPGDIQVTGTGQALFTNIDPLFAFPAIRLPGPANLEVAPGKTLALVGGNVTLQGSGLRATNGRIELGGASNGIVGLQPDLLGWKLDYTRALADRDIILKSQSAVDASGLISGGIQLVGRQIQVRDGSIALMQLFGNAPTAEVRVTATERVEVDGFDPTKLLASRIALENLSSGEASDLTVTAPELAIRNGGEITLYHLSPGRGSNMNLNIANSVLISGRSPLNISRSSRLGTAALGPGVAGNVNITTKNLRVDEGALIGSFAGSPFTTGSGGDVIINATDSVEIVGPPLTNQSALIDSSSINSSTFGRSDAGRVAIDTARLIVRDGGGIFTSTVGSGNAGEVLVNASESVSLSGAGRNTSISSAATISPIQDIQQASGLSFVLSGNAGQVAINTPNLSVTGIGSTISVANEGIGFAGDVEVNAGSIFLDDGGTILASTAFGEGGNIILQTSDLLLLRNGSQISATAGGTGNGGNITIQSPFIVAVPTENSDITANAFAGNGGNIQIATNGIFGLQFRPQLTPLSDITASSQLGVSGIVNISEFITDPSSGLTELSTTLADSSTQIKSDCSASQGGKFIVTGRGGLPPNPDERLQSDRAWVDIRDLSEFRGEATKSGEQSMERIDAQGVEANSWRTNDRGNVELVAVMPNTEASIPSVNCAGTSSKFHTPSESFSWKMGNLRTSIPKI